MYMVRNKIDKHINRLQKKENLPNVWTLYRPTYIYVYNKWLKLAVVNILRLTVTNYIQNIKQYSSHKLNSACRLHYFGL
jgi:uncharacterized iron-regulated protein